MFRVSTLDLNSIPGMKRVGLIFAKTFRQRDPFNRERTVGSGDFLYGLPQRLYLRADLPCGNSNTPARRRVLDGGTEIAFADLNDNMVLAEEMLNTSLTTVWSRRRKRWSSLTGLSIRAFFRGWTMW